MKMKGSKQVHYESGPNMTPLVDVVMVILIFLMLAGSFGSSEHFLVGQAPAGGSGGGHPTEPGRTLDVFVRAPREDDSDFVAHAAGLGDMTDAVTLTAALDGQRQRYAAAGTAPETVQVFIHPGPGVRWGPMATVYDAALRAKFQKIAFTKVQ